METRSKASHTRLCKIAVNVAKKLKEEHMVDLLSAINPLRMSRADIDVVEAYLSQKQKEGVEWQKQENQ